MLSALKAFFTGKSPFSNYFMVVGTLIALAALFGTDPDAGLVQLAFGADVVAKLSSLPATVFGVAMLWLSGKALHDYLNMKQVAEKAMETSQGAGLLYLAVALSRIAVAIVIVGLSAHFL